MIHPPHRSPPRASAQLDAIVIGASAGALAALTPLLPSLPTSLPTVIVVHLPANRPSALAEVLASTTGTHVVEAEDKVPLRPGVTYVAPPGYHLLVERDHTLALSVDETVCFSRPSIDVLFESAAAAFGERVLGIILTGANEDGAAGLRAIGEAGGVCVVQEPSTAESSIMPSAAVAACASAIVLPLEELAGWLRSLSSGALATTGTGGAHDADA